VKTTKCQGAVTKTTMTNQSKTMNPHVAVPARTNSPRQETRVLGNLHRCQKRHPAVYVIPSVHEGSFRDRGQIRRRTLRRLKTP